MNGNLNDIILDEIALEGLDGITLDGLWHRLSDRLKISLPFTTKIKTRFWEITRHLKPLNMYEIPEPRPFILFDRYTNIEAEWGLVVDPDEIPLNIYPYYPVKDSYYQGSCKHFETRIDKTKEIRQLSVEEVNERYPDKIVIVATQEVRYNTLVSNNYQLTLTPIQYCILERIGRSRYCGEVTIGKVSLQDMGESPKSLFYHRKTLLQFKLITKQPYHHKVGGSNNCGILMHLPRFYIERKPKAFLVIEEVVDMLRNKPNCLASFDELKGHFADGIKFKKIWKTSEFQRIVRTDVKMNYKDIYPNSDKNLWVTKNGENKIVRCFQLIDPNVDVSEMWTKEEAEGDDDELGLLNNKNTPFDMPLMMYALKIITSAGNKGITQNELSIKLGQNRLNARAICRNLVRKRSIVFFMDNIGRQRVTKFMSKHFIKQSEIERVFGEHVILEANKQANQETNAATSGAALKRKNESDLSQEMPAAKSIKLENNSNSVENVSNNDLNNEVNESSAINLDEDSKIVMTDSNNITTTIQLSTEVPGMKSFNAAEFARTWSGKNEKCGSTITYRFLKRMNLLIKYVKEEKVIYDLVKLVRKINEEEEADGVQTKIDKKTLYRLMLRVQQEGHVKIYKVLISAPNQNSEKTLFFICEPHIPPDHTLIQTEVERSKMKLCVNNSFSTNRSEAIESTLSNTYNNLDFGVDQSLSAVQAQHAHMKSIYKKSAGKDFGFRPRFVRLRLMHQLIHYLIYEHNQNSPVYTKNEVVGYWRQKNIEINSELYNELPDTLYSKELSWKMFIPPLPVLKDWPEGWAIVCDCIFRMPVNIFVKVVCIPYDIPELDEILKHPIKKFFLLKQLPEYIRSCLVYKRRYIFSIHNMLLFLCFMGIVQFGPQRFKEKDQLLMYLNRRAMIMDTRTSERAYNQTSIKNYPIQKFEFDCNDNVEKYWYELWNICIHTFLGLRSSEQETIIIEVAETKPLLLKYAEPRTAEEATANDVGYIPGDLRGAGGLDSALFAHVRRNWNWTNTAQMSSKVPNRTKPNKNDSNIKQKRVSIEDLASKKIFNRKKVIKVKKNIEFKAMPSSTNTVKYKSKVINVKKPPKSRKKPFYDDVDKEALKLMNKLRVDWTAEEDRILLVCKVAYVYLSPKNKKHIIVFQHVRDCLHRLLNSRNKTSRACQRRINYVLKNPSTQKSVALFLEEINQCSEIQQTFKNIPKDKLNIAFVVLVGMLLKKYGTQKNTLFLSIPDSIEEFQNKFEFYTPKLAINEMTYKKPETIQDIHFNVLFSTVHSTMCTTADKHNWSFQIFKVYQEYPETLVRSVMAQMRRSMLISIKKSIKSSKHVAKFPLVNCPYHLSQTYKNKIITKHPYEIFSDSYQTLVELNEKITSITDDNDHSIEIIAMNGGSAAAMFELYVKHNIEFQIKIPDHIIILDPSLKDREGLSKKNIDLITNISQLPPVPTDSMDMDDESELILPESKDAFLEENIDENQSPTKLSDETINSLNNVNSTALISKNSRLAIHMMRGEIRDNLESTTQRMHDLFVVNSCLIYWDAKTLPLKNLFDNKQTEIDQQLIENIQKNAVVTTQKVDCSIISKMIKQLGGNHYDNEFCTQLVSYVFDFKEIGVSSKDLENYFALFNKGFNNLTVIELLSMLVDLNIFYRGGVVDVTYVHYNFNSAWVIKSFKLKRSEREKYTKTTLMDSVQSKSTTNEDQSNQTVEMLSDSISNDAHDDDTDDLKTQKDKNEKQRVVGTKNKKSVINSFEEVNINMTPWIRIDGTLNRRILDRWLGAVLNFCIDTPGVGVNFICSRFSFLKPFEVKLLLEYLEFLKCIEINRLVINKKLSLFDDEYDVIPVKPCGTENFDELFVEVLPEAVINLGTFIGKKHYKNNFLSNYM